MGEKNKEKQGAVIKSIKELYGVPPEIEVTLPTNDHDLDMLKWDGWSTLEGLVTFGILPIRMLAKVLDKELVEDLETNFVTIGTEILRKVDALEATIYRLMWDIRAAEKGPGKAA
ncbi:MAG: hypothetical protein AB1427_08690 [Thermodesulfobacteriota bacterium]